MPALTAISDNARAVIDDMSDAVWFIDPHVDSLQQVVIRSRAMASELFDGQPIRWSVEAPDDASSVPLASEQRRHLYLIIRHSPSSSRRSLDCTGTIPPAEFALEGHSSRALGARPRCPDSHWHSGPFVA